MATFNLVRNSRVFFTTNVDGTTGQIPTSGATISSSNTFELQVLDGFSFSQATQQTTIQANEAGNTPVRGQRSFNTALDPVDFSFSTYVRPSGSGSAITAEEKVLWNALLSDSEIDAAGLSISTVSSFDRATNTDAEVDFTTVTPVDLQAAGLGIGSYITVSGLSDPTYASDWNAAAKITNISAGTASAATGITITYLEAPPVAAGTAPGTATSLKFHKGAWTAHSGYSLAHTGGSNKNQLQKFGMYFLVDSILYAVDNCVLDQASVDFGLDGIATVAWSGKGTALRRLPSATVTGAFPSAATFGGTGNATGTAAAVNTTAHFITNKLSTMTLAGDIYGSGTNYTVALTGGNVTIANNVSYVVPANLGVVNKPIGYFTGSRAISGNVTAYLKTGANNSAQVLSDILTANAAETKFKVALEIGGRSNTVHVDMIMNGCVLQVPSVETGDIMSTTINFTAQGHEAARTSTNYDLESTNDLAIKYFSV